MQKFFLHPLIAILFGLSAAHLVHTYALFDFPGATVISGLVTAGGFILISRQYDKLLTAIFLAGAIVIAIKVLPLQPPISPEKSPTEIIHQKLSVLATLVILERLDHPQKPVDVPRLAAPLLKDFFKLDACFAPHCPATGPLQGNPPDGFVLRAELTNPDDKAPPLWYLDDSFQLASGVQ